MWIFIVRHILRNRLGNLIAIMLLTAFMGYKASQVKMSYEFGSLLPASDTASIIYNDFKQRFGKDGTVMVIAIEDRNLFNLGEFDDFYDLTYNLKKIDGVQEVISTARLFDLIRNDSIKKFDFRPVVTKNLKHKRNLTA